MPEFGKRSKERLYTCQQPLISLFKEVVKTFDCSVLCGRRTKVKQNALYYTKPIGLLTRCKWPDSSHNVLDETIMGEEALSSAVDVAPYYTEKPHIRWDRKSLTRWYYFGGVVREIATRMDIKIKWGGDWDMDTYVRDQNFNDLPHWELIL